MRLVATWLREGTLDDRTPLMNEAQPMGQIVVPVRYAACTGRALGVHCSPNIIWAGMITGNDRSEGSGATWEILTNSTIVVSSFTLLAPGWN